VYALCDKTHVDQDRKAYCVMRAEAKRAIGKAKVCVERLKLSAMLEKEDVKGDSFN
jgi:hypothetical protein